jgi:predicted ATPase
MGLPPGRATLPEDGRRGEVEAYAAVAFAQTARRLQPGFMLDETNKQAVVRLCQLVEGMPLAVELAAAWIPVLEPKEITREVEHSLDILEADLRDLPARQRSMRAVFYASWEQLTPPETEAAQRLSVFRGSVKAGAHHRDQYQAAGAGEQMLAAAGRRAVPLPRTAASLREQRKRPVLIPGASENHSYYAACFVNMRITGITRARWKHFRD